MENLTRVGVHVRRSDYTAVLRKYHFGDERLLPPQYYRAAFEHYRNRFKKVLFVVITEPREYEWCKQNLIGNAMDVILAEDKCRADQDLVLLSSFEHIIYSHGTFGLWGILLSRPLTVAYPLTKIDHKSRRYVFHEIFDAFRGKTNETDYILVNYNLMNRR